MSIEINDNAPNVETAVLVTTKHRGVFFGYTNEARDGTKITLRRARCAIYFGTTRGVFELAETGPTEKSRIGARAPELTLQEVTSVSVVTDAAKAAWERA